MIEVAGDSLLNELRAEGYVEIAETSPDLSTSHVAQLICKEIGAVMANSAEILIASPKHSKPLNTYGGNYGYGQLPLHTDLAHWYRPPRYVLLRCLTGAPSVATHICSRHQLENWIPESLMKKAMFSPRRRLDGKMFLLRMVEGELLRWDQLFLKPQNAAAREVARTMQEIASKLPVATVTLKHAGQTLILDNWAVMHGRSAIPITETDRKLDRLYLEATSNGNKNTS